MKIPDMGPERARQDLRSGHWLPSAMTAVKSQQPVVGRPGNVRVRCNSSNLNIGVDKDVVRLRAVLSSAAPKSVSMITQDSH